MATATVPSASVQAKARELLARRSEWAAIRYRGMRRIVMPSASDGEVVYYVDPQGRACSCKAGRRGLVCCHRIAVTEEAHQHELAAAPAPTPRKSYRELFGVCDERSCDEDRLTNSRYCGRHFEAEVAR